MTDKRTKDRDHLIENLDRVQAEYPEARSNYDAMLEYINIFTQSAEAEMYWPCKRLFFDRAMKMNKQVKRKRRYRRPAERLFEKQFFDAGVKKEDLGDAIAKAKKEVYNAFESKEQRIDMEGKSSV